MRAQFLVAIALVGTLAGCSGQATQQEFGRASADEVRRVVQEFQEAFNSKDVQRITTIYSGSGVLMPPHSSTIRGEDSLRGFYQNRFAEGATNLEFELRDLGGQGNLAFVTGTYTVRVEPPEGGEPQRDRGKFLTLLRRMGNNWRYEYQIWSSDLPIRLEPNGEHARAN